MAENTRIERCRIARTGQLVTVLDLGSQALTGHFPKSRDEAVPVSPLELVWSPDSGLLQLRHSFEPGEMYGENYGYRSGLNQSMVDHLAGKVRMLERLVPLSPGDVVLDIGSNDATLLKSYAATGITRVGIDPTAAKFMAYYTPDIVVRPEFFSAAAFRTASPRAAKIVTSIAMFYDLEDPVAFAREIASVLASDGVWHFEQSYMPSMLRTNSYDTICHEHLEYYSLGVVQRILEAADLRIVDATMNNVNGGSFAVSATHRANKSLKANDPVVGWMLEQEDRMGLGTPRPFRDFEERVYRHRDDLTRLVRTLVADGKKIVGYGASTKGNVTLQFCGLGPAEIPAIAEVNPEKFGRFTPGTGIPIVSEQEARAMKPDYFLVLPWHFKDGILRREKEFLADGGKMIFPFPEIEIV
ncbi:class I SAM-dependent methyltransferase [Ramlibacter sp.]|uniref:class I SAM-dependent methyltransferase n=1 Tax=Ramlibacter sp. TaxID=1917967 RepID=UPI003D132B18